MAKILITYKTQEKLDHSKNQIAQIKPALLNSFYKQVNIALEKVYGDRRNNYPAYAIALSNSDKEKDSYTFDNNIEVRVLEYEQKQKNGLMTRAINILTNDLNKNEETIQYSAEIIITNVRTFREGAKTKETFKELTEVIKNCEDKDAKISLALKFPFLRADTFYVKSPENKSYLQKIFTK